MSTATKVTHTPGPWRYLDNSTATGYLVEAMQYRVALVYNRNEWDENEDNARLIAAAPDMLEILEKFVGKQSNRCECGICLYCKAERVIQFGTNADKLAHADLLQKQVLERQRNADVLCQLWNLGNAIFKDVASGGPMATTLDRVERRLAECPNCAGTGFVALGGSYEAADQRCEECKGRGRK